ncbi:di-heme oxidoredictase family protein [Photobacterium lucens]|uniref:di-heme oxidoreductase family protein n=1 Tax=Photobacterium lucens TaxID=2562949 RepID=UPI00136E343C|nr:di-heme oxidoredictase family protein [Photobacterium lucens]MBP2701770.1 c-type cytochrome [Vibrio parahaemolyticus]MZG55190.1 c-type cytochrome [Photobacterium lucens]MZG82015.1 c-type cytochrome [Photobacterium lucens]
MKFHLATMIMSLGLLPLSVLAESSPEKPKYTKEQLAKIKSGGNTTTPKTGSNAFSLPASNLPMSKRLDFSVGNSFFRNPWVQAPATTDARDGLGPIFNTNGCQNCHIKDGRGHPPEKDDMNSVSMLVRMSVPALTDEQKQQLIKSGVIPEPTYGDQLQDFALPDAKPEGKIALTYTDVPVSFADGEVITLRKPNLSITNLNYGPMADDVMLSARIAPPMIGLGLLEHIPEQTLKRFVAEQAAENKGVSGKLNQVWDVRANKTVIGRFGWKAGQPNLMQQNAAAFNGDIGLTSALFEQENCTDKQTICAELPNGGKHEASEKVLTFVEFYSQHLAVPARRNINDPQVMKGEKLFADIGCQSCHRTQIKTAKVPERPALSEQMINPYTDLLLHDMGEGLADDRPEFLANGQEWRTPPLWGLGYTEEVNGHTNFLHDGRARSVMEAVLWHGGEAQTSRDKVLQLSKSDRQALLAFLDSL